MGLPARREAPALLAGPAAGLILNLAGVAPAGAAPSDAAGRAARFEKMGRAAYQKKAYVDAIAAFEAAWNAAPLPKYLFNLGRCHERAGRPDLAMQFLERYVEAAPDAPDRGDVEALIEVTRIKLAKTHGRLRVASEPSGALATVTGAGSAVPAVSDTAPLTLWLPAGTYEIALSMTGFDPTRRTVVVRPGEAEKLHVPLLAAAGAGQGSPAAGEPGGGQPGSPPKDAAAAAPAAATSPAPAATPARAPVPPAAPAAEAEPSRGVRWLPWTVAGSGAALVATGAVLGRASREAESARDAALARPVSPSGREAAERDARAEDERAASRALQANIAYAAGGVALAAGLALTAFGGSEAGVAISPLPEGGASFVWRWNR